MRYSFYLGDIMLPVAPANLDIKYGGKLKRIDLVSGNEIVFPKTRGVAEINFSALLPRVKYPFAVYNNGFLTGGSILAKLIDMQNSGKPIRFIVLRKTAGGRTFDSTNMKVVFSEIRSKEEAAQGYDINVDIKLAEYREFAVKKVAPSYKSNCNCKSKKAAITRPVGSKPSPKTYTVVKGDCLWLIAHRFLGNGNRYPEIYNLNKTAIDARNKGTGNTVYTIYPGQVFILP